MAVNSSFLIYDPGIGSDHPASRSTPAFNALLPRYYEQLDLAGDRECRLAIYEIPRAWPVCETCKLAMWKSYDVNILVKIGPSGRSSMEIDFVEIPPLLIYIVRCLAVKQVVRGFVRVTFNFNETLGNSK